MTKKKTNIQVIITQKTKAIKTLQANLPACHARYQDPPTSVLYWRVELGLLEELLAAPVMHSSLNGMILDNLILWLQYLRASGIQGGPPSLESFKQYHGRGVSADYLSIILFYLLIISDQETMVDQRTWWKAHGSC